MITVEKAKEIMMDAISPLPIKEITLREAPGHFAATDLYSDHDHPLFHNSAVDGYAFALTKDLQEWKVVGDIAAGETWKVRLDKGECVRIFTGAMLPAGADTVVMQEYVTHVADRIQHNDNGLAVGKNVRLKGEQIKAGDLVLRKGAAITAAAAGLLASVGIRKLKVHEWPYVSIIITGGEFLGNSSEPGKIFNSNDVMLESILQSAGIRPMILRSNDDANELDRTLRQALAKSDVVITTGGVSVGEHDLVRSVLEATGADILFHKVSQKPGKPLLFGKSLQKLIFGLPGNPRAVLVLFWEYVLPAIRALMGAAEPGPKKEFLKITSDVPLKGDRSEFRAAKVHGGDVELLRDEGSHMLTSLIDANALVYFPMRSERIKAGSSVEVHPIQLR
ncbi:MAG: molybdopterin molybdotransferase MoeA [Bacteroidota bacterium]|nr:molybdopterin molybdotransferase MoeA [Bacteroidota bacterium]